MANQLTKVNLPTKVLREAGNLNDGQAYERKLLLFIAASLSQNREVKDFAIVSNPKGIEKIDDVVVRVSFVDGGKEDIALFIQSKLTTPDKLLWLNLNNKKPTQKHYEIKLMEYQKAFNDVIKMMNGNVPETEQLRKLLKNVDEKNYFVCIFTNMEKVSPKLQCKQFDEGHSIYFMDTGKCGQYHQFDYKNKTFNSNFYRQLYIFLGQPNFIEIDLEITKILGKDFKNALVNLDGTLKEFMQKADMCYVLTKAEFEVQCLKVMLDKWLRVDLGQVVEINRKFMPVWYKILSHQAVINLWDNKPWPLFANYYQRVIHEKERNQTVAELLFSLWCDNKIPLPIKSDYTQNILGFLKKFKTINNSFIIFCGKDTPELNDYRSPESVITYVREISDEETLSEMSNIQVSLEGRPPVSLAEIAGVPLETAKEGMYKDLTISQVLAWTENSKTHIIGSPLPAPDVKKYITRNFTRKDEEQNKLTEQAVLESIGPGLHIITGEPGLGKSTVLEALAHSYTPQNFIICIKLRDCLDDIENRSIWPSIRDDPIKYFFNKMTNNTDDKVTISIMETHKTSQRLCLFLDGFDEILPLHGRRISQLMEKILNNADVRIFCTTRPHAENKITSSTDIMCFELSPFDYKQIEDFFTKTNIDKEDIIWRFDFEFLGNPLHLDLISQIYVDKENRDGITRGEMYKRFIELKHEKYNKRRGFSQNDANIHYRTSMKNHRVLAMVDIFGQKCVFSEGLISDTVLADILKDICDQNIGIVDVRNSNKSFQFVHRTFAEYFVADFLLHTIVQVDSNKKYLKHFHKEVWFKNDYNNIKNVMKELTRNFDHWLEVIQYFFINSDNENESSTCSCDGYVGWLKCTMFHPNVNGCTIVNSINREYPTRRPLDVDDIDTCTKLLTAIHAENEEDVESYSSHILLDTGIGVVAFNLAIATGNERIVESLLTVRPTLVDEQDVNGNTGLHISCAFGYSSIAVLLFEQSANLGIVNKKGMTALGMATKNKQWGIWMMKHIGKANKVSGQHGNFSAAYPSVRNDISKAFLKASKNFKWNTAEKLLFEDDPELTLSNQYGWTAMHFAARGRDRLVIDMLSKRGCDVNKRTLSSETPLIIACQEGKLDIVKSLLEHGADPTLSDENGWAPMHMASMRGEVQIIDTLSGRGLDINKKTYDGKTPLYIAADWSKSDTVEWLLEHGADPTLSDENGWSPMHIACMRGQVQIIDTLSGRGLNINKKTYDGETPLSIAFDRERWDVIECLLNHGAEPTLWKKDVRMVRRFTTASKGSKSKIAAEWSTLMHFAAKAGNIIIIEMLSERGFDINAKASDGKTPLAIACGEKKSDTVTWLLAHGADPTISDEAGWNPAHIATYKGDLQILGILTEKTRLNLNAKTDDGKTPLAIACDAKKTDIFKWLCEHDATPTLSDNDGWAQMHFASISLQINEKLTESGLNINIKGNDEKTSLTNACNAKKSDTVEWLLEHGADPSLSDEAGWTPMHFAVKRGAIQIIATFLEKGLNINITPNDGTTPLIIACVEKKSETVEWLLEHGADPTLSDKDGWTPTHFAAQRGDLEILEMLTERGHSKNVKANDGKTPLIIACDAKKSDTIKWLLEHGGDPSLSDEAGWTPMHFAVKRGAIQIIAMFMEKGLNINITANDGTTPLIIACVEKKSETVEWLLEHGADPTLSDKDGWTPTHYAAQREHLEILGMLTEKGHSINVKTTDGNTPLAIACNAKKSDTVEWLLEHGADPSLSDNDGWAPVHFTSKRGALQILEILTKREFNINVKTTDGSTPLAIACDAKKSDTVEWLLEHGADPSVSDNDGWGPVHVAAKTGDLQILEKVIKGWLNIDINANDGKTPLIIACDAKKSDTVEWLLEYGADPSLSDDDGWAPVHFAAKRGDLQILAKLMKAWLNIDLKTNDGKTPLIIAYDAKKSDTVKWLLKHGADPSLSDNAGWALMHFASKRGELQILDMLTERGLNINVKTNDCNTPLAIACDAKKSDTVEWLLKHGADPSLSDEAGWAPMHFAVKRGALQILEMLTERWLNINLKTTDGNTPLAIACDEKKSDTVEWLLEHGGDPTLPDETGWTLTHFAAESGDLHILEMCSERGLNVNVKTNDGKTPLTIACNAQKSDIVKWFLEHGADPTLSDEAGWTLTHFAAESGDLQILEMCSERGLNVNVETNDGKTPLTIACNAQKFECVKWFLEHGADPRLSDEAGWTLIHFAAEQGDIQIFEMCSERGFNLNVITNDGKTPLAIACDAKKSDTVMWLLEHGADPSLQDKDGWSPTHFASHRGDLQILEMISERRLLNINEKTNDGNTPLAIACDAKNSDTVRWLLEHGADSTLSNEAGWTLAHFAAKSGHLKLIILLLEKGLNINAKTNDGKTPLAIACRAMKWDTVEWLLHLGAGATLSDKAGWTLTHFAAHKGDLEILEMLTERGFSINVKANDGKTPLAIACVEKKLDTVKWLLTHGGDPTMSDNDGWGTMHFASMRGQLQILEMLTESGLNINIKANDGKTPLIIACDAKKSKTVKWLLTHGGDPTISDNDGWGTMHFASMRGELQILEMLTEKGLNINIKANDGKTPLTVACDAKKSDTVKWLLKHGADPSLSDEADWYPAHFATHGGDLQILEMVTKGWLNIDINAKDGKTPLMIACETKKSDSVKWLLEHGADASLSDKAGWYPAHFATHKGDLQILEMVTKGWLNIDLSAKDGKTPLMIACDAKKPYIVKWLLKHGADPSLSDEAGWTPMHFSSKRGELQMLEIFTERGLNINVKTYDGNAPLAIASDAKKSDAVEWLLGHGADPSLSDEAGWTPMHFAVKGGDLQIIAMFTERGLNINITANDGTTPLIIACDEKKADTVEWLLEHGADPTVSDNDDWAPMHFASKRGELQIIEMLLDRGFHINAKARDGKTPLAIACDAKESDNVQWLLEHGADPTLSDIFGWTPMHFAAHRGDLQILEFFSQRGLNINVETNDGKTPMAIACDAKKSDTVKWLLEHGADPSLPDNDGWTPTHFAAKRDLEILKMFSEREFNLNVITNDGKTPLAIACDAKKSDSVMWLLEHGAYATLQDKDGWTATHFASHRGDLQILEMFSERRLLNINVRTNDGKTPLAIACEAKKSVTVKWLLEHGGDPTISDKDGWTPTHFAAHRGDLQVLEMFSESMLNINVKTNDGKTLLTIACDANKSDTVKWLLEQGADPNLSDKDGWTPTHFAAKTGNFRILKMFLGRGLNINAKTNDGKTPLSIACENGELDIVKLMLERSADTSISDNDGWSPMHLAARRGQLEIVQKLSEEGFNVNEKTNAGKTPITIACDSAKPNIVKWLLEHGANPTISDDNGWTPMHFTAKKPVHWAPVHWASNKLLIIKMLLEKGLNVNERNNHGQTPLAIARSESWTAMVELLLKHGSDQDSGVCKEIVDSDTDSDFSNFWWSDSDSDI